jgi:hypothetical protein
LKQNADDTDWADITSHPIDFIPDMRMPSVGHTYQLVAIQRQTAPIHFKLNSEEITVISNPAMHKSVNSTGKSAFTQTYDVLGRRIGNSPGHAVSAVRIVRSESCATRKVLTNKVQ